MDTKQVGNGVPTTIEQLKAWCALNEMPLERMRFFIGEDYGQPKAFGIYRDGDRFVVYKNKADGSRSVRYHGPDEAYAVKELYDKLLDECHKRNIWPDGRSEEDVARRKKSNIRFALLVGLIVLGFAAGLAVSVLHDSEVHAHDGYYRFNDDGLYYAYGSNWYYDDDDYDWALMNDMAWESDYDAYYLGDEYSADWGYSDFEDSKTWEDIQAEQHTSSQDYDSWDSSDTNWDSDW